MEPINQPTRKRVGRKPYGLPRLTSAEFSQRCLYSRQHEEMKAAVKRVVVAGGLVSDVAADLGHSRQNIHDGVSRFLDSTAWPTKHMSPQEFDFAKRGRSSRASLVEAARLYLVEGYSVSEACKATNESDILIKDLVKRMRSSLRRVYGVLPPPERGVVYTGPYEDFKWPTADEMDQLAESCLVRPAKAITYSRASMVLVLKMSPSEVTKLTTSTLQFVIDSVDKVVERLEQHRLHMQFPKSEDYLATMRLASAKRVSNDTLRCAVETYLGQEPDLANAALVADVGQDVLFRAVRTTVHEMARLKKNLLEKQSSI